MITGLVWESFASVMGLLESEWMVRRSKERRLPEPLESAFWLALVWRRLGCSLLELPLE
jgi:hypothetical protein